MAGVTTNLVAGPATLYTGPFGATEPANSAVATPPASPFTGVGFTNDGMTLNCEMKYYEFEVDQIVDTPERRLVKRDFQIETKLAEATLENLKATLNGGTITEDTTFSTYDPADDTSATQPAYSALIADGYAPRTTAGGTMRRRLIVRKILSVDGMKSESKKDKQTEFPVKFAAHYVSPSVKPFRLIDQTG